MFPLHMLIRFFTIALYTVNFVLCKIFLLHKIEFSMLITLLVSLILFSISRSDEPLSWTTDPKYLNCFTVEIIFPLTCKSSV
jgi:hypothetical protein